MHDSFHTADANDGSTLNEFLGDDFGRGFRIEEAMTDDLADDFAGASVVLFRSAWLGEQSLGSGFLELLSELKIALATESELLGSGLGSQFTLAFEQHGDASGHLIVLWDGETSGGTDKRIGLEVKQSQDPSSLKRSAKRASVGG